MGCVGQTGPIHGGHTPQLTGPKGSFADILVPDTTAHGFSGVHALTGQRCFDSKRWRVVIMLCLIGVVAPCLAALWCSYKTSQK